MTFLTKAYKKMSRCENRSPYILHGAKESAIKANKCVFVFANLVNKAFKVFYGISNRRTILARVEFRTFYKVSDSHVIVRKVSDHQQIMVFRHNGALNLRHFFSSIEIIYQVKNRN